MQKYQKNNNSPSILVAPLNWGLGHATRCIPIIHKLLDREVSVILASDGRALELLRDEFPNLNAISLPSYKIEYSAASMVWNMAKQLPNITTAVIAENKMLRKIVCKHSINAIISDNRFGCYHPDIYSIYMTHQLTIKMSFRWMEALVRRVNHFWIKKYDECWIPDNEGVGSLAGELSENKSEFNLPPVSYLGTLSRMKKLHQPNIYQTLTVLSGPEPQRSILEKKISEQLLNIPGNHALVRGVTEDKSKPFQEKNTTVFPFCTSDKLNQLMASAECIIARSGYSTLMDLAAVQKPAILIPTPGQTEQEYLATMLKKMRLYNFQDQIALNIRQAMKELLLYKGFEMEASSERLLSQAVDGLTSKIQLVKKRK